MSTKTITRSSAYADLDDHKEPQIFHVGDIVWVTDVHDERGIRRSVEVSAEQPLTIPGNQPIDSGWLGNVGGTDYRLVGQGVVKGLGEDQHGNTTYRVAVKTAA